MRRLIVLSALSVAAFGAFTAPASAGPAPCYGVDLGSTHTGVCGGIECARICGIAEPTFYCYDDTGSGQICGLLAPRIG